MLRYQYRMHAEIQKFPSQHFYEGRLLSGQTLLRRGPASWHSSPQFPPYCVWNTPRSVMNRNKTGSLRNDAEIRFIENMLFHFSKCIIDREPRSVSVGIASFYSSQVSFLRIMVANLNNRFPDRFANMAFAVSTVDGFQGSEMDVIILSCVRSSQFNRNSPSLGFLRDYRRMNVAVTRAKLSLWIVGNCDMLVGDPVWKAMIDDAHRRNLIRNERDLDSLSSPHGPREPRAHRKKRTGRGRNGRRAKA